jgi:asparagine synthase (glutamine-hydrolysing)
MCGIAGYVGRFDEALLGAMSDRIAHRGPDDDGLLVLRPPVGPGLGLAHRRLSIIDLTDAGRQPMGVDCRACGGHRSAPEAKRLWLIYNGEIYNHRELRAELEGKGHTFFSRTDSEVLLHLYAEEGRAMLGRLNGIFAFALYDGRPRGAPNGGRPGDLLLARDGFGVKPLYLAETDDGVLFASELKALLAHRGLSREIDLVAIHHYMSYLWCPAPRTPLKAVQKVEPGTAMIVRQGRITDRWSFYDLPYGRPPRRESDEATSRGILERLEQAVERQLVADVEVGAFLSGGLDSSAIVAMMRRLQPDARVPCYSIGFKNGETLEGHSADLPYARKVAKHLGVDLRVLEVGPEIIDHLPTLLFHLDEPQVDPAPINSLLIARQAAKDGVKVLMSGQGGDDIFTGYRRHKALRMERVWGGLPRPLRRAVGRPAGAAYNGRAGFPWMHSTRARQAVRALAHADLDGDERLISYFHWGGESLRRSLYSERVIAALDGHETSDPLLSSLARIPGEREPINRMLYLEARHFLADHNLAYTDKTSMAAGVEVRVPLLDPDLVEYAAGIPVAAKMRGGVPKAAFKRAMESMLPLDVVHRPKTGFGAPLRRWMDRELRPLVDDLLSPRSLRSRGLFDPVAVQRLVDLDRARRVDGAYNVFGVMCVELWCRIFLDGDGAPP